MLGSSSEQPFSHSTMPSQQALQDKKAPRCKRKRGLSWCLAQHSQSAVCQDATARKGDRERRQPRANNQTRKSRPDSAIVIIYHLLHKGRWLFALANLAPPITATHQPKTTLFTVRLPNAKIGCSFVSVTSCAHYSLTLNPCLEPVAGLGFEDPAFRRTSARGDLTQARPRSRGPTLPCPTLLIFFELRSLSVPMRWYLKVPYLAFMPCLAFAILQPFPHPRSRTTLRAVSYWTHQTTGGLASSLRLLESCKIEGLLHPGSLQDQTQTLSMTSLGRNA